MGAGGQSGNRRAAEVIVVNVRHPKTGQGAGAVRLAQELIGVVIREAADGRAVGHCCDTASPVIDVRYRRRAVAVGR